jgi:hypothetical protein
MGRLRWKKDPPVTGLARIGASPRGSKYWDGETVFARIANVGKGWRKTEKEGWFFTSNVDGWEYKNSVKDGIRETEAEAKKDAVAWVKASMKKYGKVLK